MERKGHSTAVMEVQAGLPKAFGLSSEEEKVLRMRYGAKASEAHATLPLAAGDNQELADELLLIEMQLFRAKRARLGKLGPTRLAPRNAAKEKIVRALRKKR